MNTPQVSKSKKSKKVVTWKLLITVVVVILVLTQLERLLRVGTILGYQVRTKRITAIESMAKNYKAQSSQACSRATADEVGGILKIKVTRIGGSFADRKEPTFISACTYRSADRPARTTTIIMRDANNEATAKQNFSSATKRKGASKVDGLGDEATFSTTSQQLTVRDGRRMVTVAVSKPANDKQVSSKDASISIAKQVL